MAITEKFTMRGKARDGKGAMRARRTVTITGEDLPKFAAVLREQAAAAEAQGEMANGSRLRNLAAHIDQARSFTVKVPPDAKLN